MLLRNRLVAVLLVSMVLFSLGGCAVKIDPPRDISSEDEAVNMGFVACEYESKLPKGEYQYLDVEIKLNYEREVRWSSSNPDIATVDSNGRVDAVKEGVCTITASAKSASIDYEIEVVKAEKTPITYTTAITANEDSLEINKAQISENNPYAIIVNKYNNCVTVYTYNEKGVYNIPVRAMACSTGENGSTPLLDGAVTEKSEWIYQDDNYYYCYTTYVGNKLMLRSTPYSEKSPDSLVYEEYNKLGEASTQKDIQLAACDAKWIYDNCGEGTQVRVVDSDNLSWYSPLGVPETLKLNENSPSLKWDPTNNKKENPYSKLKPLILGADDTVVEAQSGFDPYNAVSAVDICYNDITAQIRVDGDFDRDAEGTYVISYYVTDALGRTARHDRRITVVRDIEEYQSTSQSVE